MRSVLTAVCLVFLVGTVQARTPGRQQPQQAVSNQSQLEMINRFIANKSAWLRLQNEAAVTARCGSIAYCKAAFAEAIHLLTRDVEILTDMRKQILDAQDQGLGDPDLKNEMYAQDAYNTAGQAFIRMLDERYPPQTVSTPENGRPAKGPGG